MILRRLGLATLAIVMTASTAFADPIEGLWKTEAGSTASVATCAQGFCITLKSGTYAGKRIGELTLTKPGRYEGTVTDPADDKTYSGKATVNGSTLKLTGCALAFLCRTQTWARL